MQRALVAGLLIAVIGSYFGAFVVQRGLGFLGDGLAHAAFGGVALALLLNTEPLWIAVPFTIVVAVAITWVRERTDLGSDTAVGIFFSLSVALGVVFMSLKRGYSADAFSFLFGSILSVTTTDLYVTGIVLLLALLFQRMWGRWAYATFDRELALADRLPVLFDDYILAIFIAVTVVIGVKLVGIVLVTSFLVIPAATARLFSRSFSAMTVLAATISIVCVVVGLDVSYRLDIPSGATIVFAQSAAFFASVALTGRRRKSGLLTPPVE